MYQLIIASSILVSSFYGRMIRNIVTVIVCAFTLFNVFSEGLMILQFATIFFAFQLSQKIPHNKNNEVENSKVLFKDKELEHKETFFSPLSILVIIVVIIIGIVITQYINEMKK